MVQSVPTREPAAVTAGDTVTWSKSLADYLASAGWTLKYRLINAAGKIDITAAASGDDHLVSEAAATSVGWTAGTYTWTAWVEGGTSERYTVGSGSIIVRPNLAAEAAGYETRSTAAQTLALLDAALLAHGSNAWTAEYSVAGRSMKFNTPGDFMAFRSRVKAEVNAEENAARLAAGLASKTKILVRF